MDAASGANLIASVAFVVAAVSAIFAWKSANEARLANKISIHEYQRKLYEAFIDAFHLLQREGQRAEIGEFSKIIVHLKTARFYFDESISTKLKEFSDAYIDVYDGECKVKYTSKVSAEASKRYLEEGSSSSLDKALSEKADKAAEDAQLDVDFALNKVLKIGADLDAMFMEKIRLD